MKKTDGQQSGVFSGVLTGYLILVAHILLIIILGLAVILLKGLYDIRWLVIIVGLCLIAGSGYYFYRRIKNSNRKLMDLVNDPALKGKTVEISLFGGMATFKLGDHDHQLPLINDQNNEIKQLEAPGPKQLTDLSELKEMLDDGLITREEFLKLKKEII